MVLQETNPLEDLRGLITSPLRFCASLAQLKEVDAGGFLLWKAVGGALFFFSLYYLSTIPASLGQTVGFLSWGLDKLSPFLKLYDINPSEVLEGKILAAIFLHLSYMGSFFLRLVAGFFGLLLMSGVVALWKNIHFREALVMISYAHWLLVFGLLAHGIAGILFVQFLILLFIARVLLQRERLAGFWKTMGTVISLTTVFAIASLYGMTLS